MSKKTKPEWTICTDTLCTGYTPITVDAGEDNPDGTPIAFDTEAAAQAEMDSDPEFYEDCFVTPMSDIGRKAIFTGKE